MATLGFVTSPYFDDHIVASFRDIHQQLRLASQSPQKELILVEFPEADLKLAPPKVDALFTVGSAGLTLSEASRMRAAGTKLFIFWDDIHYFDAEQQRRRHMLYSMSDYLLLPYQYQFVRTDEYRDYWEKAILFPWFAPDRCLFFGDSFAKRAPRALLSGNATKSYDFRRKLFQMAPGLPQLDTLTHPGYDRQKRKHQIVRDAYFSHVAGYQAAIATSAVNRHTVCKYLEIPAVGTVLLAEPTPDLFALGFVDDLNAIFVDEGNFSSVVAGLFVRSDLEQIAERGRRLIRERHTTTRRIAELLEIVAERIA